MYLKASQNFYGKISQMLLLPIRIFVVEKYNGRREICDPWIFVYYRTNSFRTPTDDRVVAANGTHTLVEGYQS